MFLLLSLSCHPPGGILWSFFCKSVAEPSSHWIGCQLILNKKNILLLANQPRTTVSQGAGVFYLFTLLQFNSQAPQYIQTPPPSQPLARTWQRSRSQAEQAAPRLLSAIQTFLKTHNKHRLRELALILVNSETMEIYLIHLRAGLALRPFASHDAVIALQGFGGNASWCLVWQTQHKGFERTQLCQFLPAWQEAKTYL